MYESSKIKTIFLSISEITLLKYLNKSKINNIQIQFFFIFKKLDMINYLLYVNKYFSQMKKTKNFKF